MALSALYHHIYATLGTFVNEASMMSNYRYMQKYFESVQKKQEDYLTVYNFIWRWDSDWFWCSKAFFVNYTIPRVLFGKWMLKSESYWKLLRLDQKYHMADTMRKLSGEHEPLETIIQDAQIPIEKASEFWKFFTKNIAIRPVWFCPTRSSTSAGFPLYELKPDEVYINFGFWDQMPARMGDPHYYNKLIEAKVDELGGKKAFTRRHFIRKATFGGFIMARCIKSKKKSMIRKVVLKICIKSALNKLKIIQ